jgi:CheY-like chemotaxis protein
LTDAIQALKPEPSVPPGSHAWRIYQVLYYRFAEQTTQREVAAELGLSIRQLRRHEKTAIQVLGDYLWNARDLEHKGQLLDSLAVQQPDPMTCRGTPSRKQELDWIVKTAPIAMINLEEMLSALLDVIQPLMQQLQVSVTCDIPPNLPPIAARCALVRQALLYLLTVATRHASQGQIQIEARPLPQHMSAQVSIIVRRTNAAFGEESETKTGEAAHELVRISGGTLELDLDRDPLAPFAATVVLPTAEQVPVLVIDDNADTLRLIERYLSGTHYLFAGTSAPEQALELAEKVGPSIIVLDVMLPGTDGWELLGRLREHPQTRGIPILVCTILPQAQLALTLGAAAFLRKPVNRMTLLSALDRQLEPQAIGSR